MLQSAKLQMMYQCRTKLFLLQWHVVIMMKVKSIHFRKITFLFVLLIPEQTIAEKSTK